MEKTEQSANKAVADLTSYRLVCIITPVRVDAWVGESVHLAIDIRSRQGYSNTRAAKQRANWVWFRIQSFRRPLYIL